MTAFRNGEASLESCVDAIDSALDRPAPAFKPVGQKLASFDLLKQNLRIIVDLQELAKCCKRNFWTAMRLTSRFKRRSSSEASSIAETQA